MTVSRRRRRLVENLRDVIPTFEIIGTLTLLCNFVGQVNVCGDSGYLFFSLCFALFNLKGKGWRQGSVRGWGRGIGEGGEGRNEKRKEKNRN